MKRLIQIFKRTSIEDDIINLEDEMFVRYSYKPNTRDELIGIIYERLKENVEEPYLLDIDVSNITSFKYLFSSFYWRCKLNISDVNPDCIKKLDLSTWNVSNVTDMCDIFWGCDELIEIIGLQNWNVSKVKSFSAAFYHCKNLRYVDLSSFKRSMKQHNSPCAFDYCDKSIIPDWVWWKKY